MLQRYCLNTNAASKSAGDADADDAHANAEVRKVTSQALEPLLPLLNAQA
eukprot:COSAG02_NODE_1908_length_10422_cov_3.592270_5_plen_50_part_00